MKSVDHPCPACGSAEMSVFYEVRRVPVNSVLLVMSRGEAPVSYTHLTLPTSDLV